MAFLYIFCHMTRKKLKKVIELKNGLYYNENMLRFSRRLKEITDSTWQECLHVLSVISLVLSSGNKVWKVSNNSTQNYMKKTCNDSVENCAFTAPSVRKPDGNKAKSITAGNCAWILPVTVKYWTVTGVYVLVLEGY